MHLHLIWGDGFIWLVTKFFNFTYLDQWLSSELMERLIHRILKTRRKQISTLAATLTYSAVTPQLYQELHLIRNNVIAVSVCLPSDSLSQHLLSYWGFFYLGHGVSLHCCSSEVQPLILSLDMGELFTAAATNLGCRVSPLGSFSPLQQYVNWWTSRCSRWF